MTEKPGTGGSESGSPDPDGVWPLAVHYALRWRVGEANAEDIADTITERIKAARRETPGYLADEKALKRFLFTAVKNSVRNLCRDTQRYVSLHAVPEEELVASGAVYTEPEEEEPPDPRLALIYSVVESLPERCREIWYLMNEDGLKPRHIAPLLGIGVRSVNTQAYRAKKKMDEARARYEAEHPAEKKP